MEFSTEHTQRHQQLTDIQENAADCYAQLKIKHEILHQEMVEYKTKANYWEAQFNKFKSREELLKTEIEELKAQLRKREHPLFGKKSEKNTTQNELLPSAQKLLKSLNKHWNGLTVFIDHPLIPMDNNTAERGLRGSVIGRKNYYGSGAVWSAELAAALFTLFGTLKLWKLNLHTWLLSYFYECAMLGGKPPEDIQKYLPWKMTQKQKELFSEPPRYENSE